LKGDSVTGPPERIIGSLAEYDEAWQFSDRQGFAQLLPARIVHTQYVRDGGSHELGRSQRCEQDECCAIVEVVAAGTCCLECEPSLARTTAPVMVSSRQLVSNRRT